MKLTYVSSFCIGWSNLYHRKEVCRWRRENRSRNLVNLPSSGDLRWRYKIKGKKVTLLHLLAWRIPESFFSVVSTCILYNVDHSQVLRILSWGASLVAQWLRICLLMQGTRVRALVWEDPMCHGAAGPVSHSYWACASGACAPQQERPR